MAIKPTSGYRKSDGDGSLEEIGTREINRYNESKKWLDKPKQPANRGAASGIAGMPAPRNQRTKKTLRRNDPADPTLDAAPSNSLSAETPLTSTPPAALVLHEFINWSSA